MEADFVTHFKEVFPRFIIYLIVPFYLGLQLSQIAKEERAINKDHKAGSYALDAVGLFFGVGVPAFMVAGSLAVFNFSESHPEFMGVLFRYGLMFFFLGMWWQFFGIMALKAYRDREKKSSRLKYLLFYAGGSVFISLNAFLGGEWFLKWASLIFLTLMAPLLLLPCSKMCKAFLGASVLAFVVQAAGLIYLTAMI